MSGAPAKKGGGGKRRQELSSRSFPIIPVPTVAIRRAPTRAEALRKLAVSLREYQIAGLPNNLEFLERCVAHPAFQVGPPSAESFSFLIRI